MTVVLDASALLAFYLDEPGANVVADAIPDAVISTANLAEVATKLIVGDATRQGFIDDFDPLRIAVEPFSREMSYLSAELRQPTRAIGLSLGDRACLALALHLGVPAMTADRRWARLDVGVDVRLIRDAA